MRCRAILLFSGLSILAIVGGRALAHEGHAALASKGATVEGDTVRLTPEARAAIGLTLTAVDTGPIEATIRVNADVSIVPDLHAFASTRLEGRVTTVSARSGDIVVAGQELARIESPALDALIAELVQAETRLAFARTDRARSESLFGKGLAAEKERLETGVTARALEIEVDATRRRLAAVGLPRGEIDAVTRTASPASVLVLRAPIGGVVLHADIELGRFVAPTEHLFEIVDGVRVRLVGEIPEDMAGTVTVGASVRARFRALPGRVFEGAVERRAPAMDRRKAALGVSATVDNSDRTLLAGLGGEMEIVVERRDAVTLAPLAGIKSEPGRAFAFVEQAAGTYLRKDLVLGRRQGDLVEVKAGLYPGDRIVAAGKHELAGLFVQGVLALSPAARKNLGLETAEVDVRPVEDVVHAFGTVAVRSGGTFAAASRVAGKVSRVGGDVGDPVPAGAVVAVVESLEVESLEIDLRKARLEVDLAEATLARLEALAKEGIPAQRDLLVAERAVLERRNTVSALRRRLEVLGVPSAALDRVIESGEASPLIEIRSPFAGVVRARTGVPGMVVKPGDVLVEIVDLGVVTLELAIAQDHVRTARPGIPLRAVSAAYPRRTFDGLLRAASPVLDEETRSLLGYADLENRGHALFAGLRCEAALVVGPPLEALAVPRTAIGDDGGRPFAIVVGGNGKFERVYVELGRGDDRLVEVKKGLYPGDQVATRGVEALRSALASVK